MFPILLLALTINNASLAETSSSFEVSAKIENGCIISNLNQKLDFGSKSAFSQEVVFAQITNNAQSWDIQCTVGLPVSINLNSGDNFGNGSRRLKLPSSPQSEYIPYRLYSDAARSNEYISGQNFDLSSSPTNASTLQFSIYGAADLTNSNQFRPAGKYSDLVSITISW